MRDEAWRIPLRERPWYQRATAWVRAVVGRATPDWVRSLSIRVVTAFIAIPSVLAVLWFGGWVAFGAAVLILAGGMVELHKMMAKMGYHPLGWLSFFAGIALLVGAMFPSAHDAAYEVTISVLVLGSLSWLLVRRPRLGTALVDWALTLVMTLYLAWPLSYLLLLRGMTPGAGTPHFWWLLVLFFGEWAFDSAAFFTGRFFGKHLLAPTTSPNKTWEGVVGGTLLTIAAVYVFTRPIAPAVAWYHVLVLGVLVSFAAMLGDLAESFIKRQADVKDSGTFFRGHGGVLDRIDSLLFVCVVVYFYTTLVLHFA